MERNWLLFCIFRTNVAAQDLHWGLLSGSGAWDEHHQPSIYAVAAVNKWLQDECLVWLGLIELSPFSWRWHTVLCRGRSGWTWGRSCSPSGCRLSSELPGSWSQWARGDSGWWHFWCGSPGLSVTGEVAIMSVRIQCLMRSILYNYRSWRHINSDQQTNET